MLLDSDSYKPRANAYKKENESGSGGFETVEIDKAGKREKIELESLVGQEVYFESSLRKIINEV